MQLQAIQQRAGTALARPQRQVAAPRVAVRRAACVRASTAPQQQATQQQQRAQQSAQQQQRPTSRAWLAPLAAAAAPLLAAGAALAEDADFSGFVNAERPAYEYPATDDPVITVLFTVAIGLLSTVTLGVSGCSRLMLLCISSAGGALCCNQAQRDLTSFRQAAHTSGSTPGDVAHPPR